MGANCSQTKAPSTVTLTVDERGRRVLATNAKKSKMAITQFEQCAFEFAKNTKNTFLDKVTKSRRPYSGVMLKVPPTKGHKKSR